MRIAIGGIIHESNSFNPTLTDLKAFQSGSLTRGEDMLSFWGASHHEIGGFIEGSQRFGYELVPTLVASATPSGPVSADAFESLTGELLHCIRSEKHLDGLLLSLHGAMVSEGYPDGDGEIVQRLRQDVGPDFPIVVTHDFHANISQRIIHHSTALVVYKTNPHIDQRERGVHAAQILIRTLRGEIQPVQALVKPPVFLNICFHNTSRPPLRPILEAARQLEVSKPAVLAASFAGGYQYADVHEMGPSAVVVTDNNPDLAEKEAQRLARMLWDVRDRLTPQLPDASEAVRRAMTENSPPPTILVDMGDNIGGGSAGDGTYLLKELLTQNASRWLVVLADPEAVQECIRVGVRQPISLAVGGKTDSMHGPPVVIHGQVRSLHDGRFEEAEPRHGGLRLHDQGPTAVIEVPDATGESASVLILTSRRTPPFSLQQLLSLGIDPSRRRIIVVKAAVAFRAAYEAIAGNIIEVDTPGLTCVNPARFSYKRVPPLSAM